MNMDRYFAADLLERLVCGDVGDTRWQTRMMLERGACPIGDDIAFLALEEAGRGLYPLLEPAREAVVRAINVLGLRPWASTYRKALPPGETGRVEEWAVRWTLPGVGGPDGRFVCREDAETWAYLHRRPGWEPEIVHRWVDVSPWEPA